MHEQEDHKGAHKSRRMHAGESGLKQPDERRECRVGDDSAQECRASS